ncbi:hypothetical protein BDF19DRAFT_149981 [Syncephalis fuscata]|nr:hypothetical protein BDF19DRAFT_149981 [Syncephalis fuscata]
MPNLPFWREQAHRHAVLSSYRSLQRLATQFDSSLHKRYLYYEIRERFRYHQHSTSLQQTKQLLAEANLVYDKLKQASLGEVETMRWLDNHAQAKTGRLYQVLTKIQLHQRVGRLEHNIVINTNVVDTISLYQ